MASGATLSIGSYVIKGDWGRPESKADSDQDGLSLQLERQGQMKLTKLVRPVTIVGDAAPSLMRWKGVGLSPCHGAIISQSRKIWYLPFSNDPLAVNPSDFIQQIDFDNPVQIGQVTVRRWSLETANRKSPPTKRMPSSENRPSPSASRPSKADMPTSTNASNLPVDVTDEVMRRMVELATSCFAETIVLADNDSDYGRVSPRWLRRLYGDAPRSQPVSLKIALKPGDAHVSHGLRTTFVHEAETKRAPKVYSHPKWAVVA